MTQSQLGVFLIALGCVATVLIVLYALANALAEDPPPDEDDDDDTDLYTPQSADEGDVPLCVLSIDANGRVAAGEDGENH